MLNTVIIFLVGTGMFMLYVLLDTATTSIQNGHYIRAGIFGLVSLLLMGLLLGKSQSALIKALKQERKCRCSLEERMRCQTDELKQINEELKSLVLNDELTNLYNRRGFYTLAEHSIKVGQRDNKDIMVLFADIDGMKEINDNFGHQEGDRALKTVAGILKDTFRTSDIVARIGGDEFAALSLQTSWDNADVLAERLQKNLNAFNDKKMLRYSLSVSTGLAVFSDGYHYTVAEMLQNADEMMYMNKRNKKRLA
jgi:diguanylate cyclase (GGDEF)-like protein